VLGLVTGDERLPHVVVREVPVLVVRRVEVREVERAERGGELERAAARDPGAGELGDATSGGCARGAQRLRYAIWTPTVESTRSAASIRLVRSTG
jgi:hypothetical protein